MLDAMPDLLADAHRIASDDVTTGATTIRVRMDSMRSDSSVNVTGMTSFNHNDLGAVADWLHKVVAGIDAPEPGCRADRVAPRPGGDLTSATASPQSPNGEPYAAQGGERTSRAELT